MTLADFEHRLSTENEEGRAYLIGKLMRQAKPDDVFTFVTVAEILELWPRSLSHGMPLEPREIRGQEDPLATHAA